MHRVSAMSHANSVYMSHANSVHSSVSRVASSGGKQAGHVRVEPLLPVGLCCCFLFMCEALPNSIRGVNMLLLPLRLLLHQLLLLPLPHFFLLLLLELLRPSIRRITL